MAKRNRKTEEVDGQQDLIDVHPENEKKIIAAARRYKKAQAARIKALDDEVNAKQELLQLVKEADLQRLDDGKIQFRIDGMTITVTPRDELIRVKEEEEKE